MRHLTFLAPLGLTLMLVPGCGRLHDIIGNKRIAPKETRMLVLGDSLSTGLFTSSDFWLNYGGIVSAAVKGEHLGGPAHDEPTLIREPKEEVSMLGFAGPAAAAALLRVVEWPRLSWGSTLAEGNGLAQHNLVIAAENGATSQRAKAEVDAWLADVKDKSKPQLPDTVFLFFTGDDLCQSEDKQNQSTPPAAFQQGIEDAVLNLATGATANSGGTRVYLVSHMSILQLVQNQRLLEDKKIHVTDAYGDRHISCIDFLKEYEEGKRAVPPIRDLVSFTYNPMHLCYNVLAHAPGLDPAHALVPLTKLEDLIAGYRQALHQAAADLTAKAQVQAAGMELHVITTTEDLVETPDDIANECFHLSGAGQNKIAKAIQEGIANG